MTIYHLESLLNSIPIVIPKKLVQVPPYRKNYVNCRHVRQANSHESVIRRSIGCWWVFATHLKLAGPKSREWGKLPPHYNQVKLHEPSFPNFSGQTGPKYAQVKFGSFPPQVRIGMNIKIYMETTTQLKTGWWFQPIWKIWVKLDHFPR